MNKAIVLGTLIFLCCFSCKKNTSEIASEAVQAKELDSLSTDKINLKLLSLSPDAEEKIASFEDFKNLRKLIQTLTKSNPFYIQKYADSTDMLVQNFKESLEEGGGDINVNSIKSRVVVLQTESGLLGELASKKNADSKKLLDANIRLLTAYNSLIIQLNELSLAIPENIEKELLRDLEIYRDSITDPNQ